MNFEGKTDKIQKILVSDYSVWTTITPSIPFYFDNIEEIAGHYIRYIDFEKNEIYTGTIVIAGPDYAIDSCGLTYKFGKLDWSYNIARLQVVELRRKVKQQETIITGFESYLHRRLHANKVLCDAVKCEGMANAIISHRLVSTLLLQIQNFLSGIIKETTLQRIN